MRKRQRGRRHKGDSVKGEWVDRNFTFHLPRLTDHQSRRTSPEPRVTVRQTHGRQITENTDGEALNAKGSSYVR